MGSFILLGLPEDVISAVHLCCGYPTHCDQDDYMKADKNLYKTLAPLLDNSGIKQFSIEDAEAQNNLEDLLPLFKKSTVDASLKSMDHQFVNFMLIKIFYSLYDLKIYNSKCILFICSIKNIIWTFNIINET